jgi:hypothetical protein
VLINLIYNGLHKTNPAKNVLAFGSNVYVHVSTWIRMDASIIVCDELTKTLHGYFTFNLLQEFYSQKWTNCVSMIATTKRKYYATYNSNDDSHLAHHLPNDCIPTNLRINRQRKLVVATFNTPDLEEKTIMKNQPECEDCFIENTIVFNQIVLNFYYHMMN